MFQLETDLSCVSIAQLGRGQNEKNHSLNLMYAMYKRACPIPYEERAAVNHLTLWTEPFFTHNTALVCFSLWEPDVIYRLPQVALDALCEGDDLCAAPVRVEFTHEPYAALTVDEHRRASANAGADRQSYTTALHIGSYTPCFVASRDELVDWVDCISSTPFTFPFFTSGIEERGLDIGWLDPLLRSGDVRIEHLPGLLDRPVDLVREKVSRETV